MGKTFFIFLNLGKSAFDHSIPSCDQYILMANLHKFEEIKGFFPNLIFKLFLCADK
jgi:hypothetical protein